MKQGYQEHEAWPLKVAFVCEEEKNLEGPPWEHYPCNISVYEVSICGQVLETSSSLEESLIKILVEPDEWEWYDD